MPEEPTWLDQNWQWLVVVVVTALGALGTWWPYIRASFTWGHRTAKVILGLGLLSGLALGLAELIPPATSWQAFLVGVVLGGVVVFGGLWRYSRILTAQHRAAALAPDTDLTVIAGRWEAVEWRATTEDRGEERSQATAWFVSHPMSFGAVEAEVQLPLDRSLRASEETVDAAIAIMPPDDGGALALLRVDSHGQVTVKARQPDGPLKTRWSGRRPSSRLSYRLVLARTEGDSFRAIVNETVVCERTAGWPQSAKGMLYVSAPSGVETDVFVSRVCVE